MAHIHPTGTAKRKLREWHSRGADMATALGKTRGDAENVCSLPNTSVAVTATELAAGHIGYLGMFSKFCFLWRLQKRTVITEIIQ